VIVALTGTDLYRDLSAEPEARGSLLAATRVIVLQNTALEELDREVREKTSVIYQSASGAAGGNHPRTDRFNVCVLSHLREVKDPLRAAFAARLLPADSKIHVVHAGRALEPEWTEKARNEERQNFRYRWIGEQPHDDALQLLARSRIFVLSSKMEGGANAIAEAVRCGVPVICSDIPGNVGMLDRGYAGYFPAGGTKELASLLYAAETDAVFLRRLQGHVLELQDRFDPQREMACWRDLLQLLFS
jgi:putative glycosyltransferase (TIGR04348 family)